MSKGLWNSNFVASLDIYAFIVCGVGFIFVYLEYFELSTNSIQQITTILHTVDTPQPQYIKDQF